jgi:hypothetical protein
MESNRPEGNKRKELPKLEWCVGTEMELIADFTYQPQRRKGLYTVYDDTVLHHKKFS